MFQALGYYQTNRSAVSSSPRLSSSSISQSSYLARKSSCDSPPRSSISRSGWWDGRASVNKMPSASSTSTSTACGVIRVRNCSNLPLGPCTAFSPAVNVSTTLSMTDFRPPEWTWTSPSSRSVRSCLRSEKTLGDLCFPRRLGNLNSSSMAWTTWRKMSMQGKIFSMWSNDVLAPFAEYITSTML